MKQISTSLTSKLKQDKIIERDYIIFKGETTRHYLWFNLYDDCYKDGNFIGTFVMKRIEITYNDSDLEFKNKEFNAYKEYKLDNETWESVNYGTFVVTNVDPSDTKEEIKVTAYDYALKFANTYKTDLDYASGTITLFQVLQEVCQKVGVELENTSIDNGNFIVDSNQFGENTLYGNVVTAIAQISCNFAKITPENKLKLLFKNESNIIIETKDYEEFEDKRDTQPYNAVSLGLSDIEGENVTLVAQGVDPDEAKYLTINDNPFAYTQDKRTQLIQAIFDKINGFGYSSFVLSNCLYPQLECGDLIKIRNKDGQLVDSIVLRPTFEETVLNFEAPSTITSSVTYVQPVDAIEIAKRTEIIVNKQEQTIQAVVESNQEVVSKTAQLSIEVDELKGQISEAADVTITADGYGSISADNINVSEPILLRIRPVGEDFACIYPRTNLYPSSTLFPKNRKITFENTTTNEKIEYTIPKDLWYFDSNNYDEFVLDYENAQCYILHKVGVNADGTKYILEMPTTEYFDYPTINLTEGDYKIYTNSFSNAYIYVRLMTQNIYTSQFATKVELNSSLKQTSSSIIAEVNGTIDTVDKDLNAKLELKVDTENLISEINASAENVNINSSKLNLEGYTTINNNFKIDENGDMECSNAQMNGIIKGSTFKGTNDNSIYLKIGDDPADTSSFSTNNCFQILRPDNTNMLTISSRYWDSSSTLKQIVFESPVRSFSFVSNVNDSRVQANAFVADSFMYSPAYNGGSLESIKKNIKLFDKSGLNIINNAELYSYNLKAENDKDKKHIGLVIPDMGGKYKTPNEVISKDNKGIDLYSMISVAWKAVQEQQEIINNLQERIKILENEKNINNK